MIDSDYDDSDDGSDFDLPNFDSTQEEEEYYGPLYRFWRYNDMSRTLMIGEYGAGAGAGADAGEVVDYYPIIENCLITKLTSQPQTY